MDKELKVIEKGVKEIALEAETYTIVDKKTMEQATEMLSQINQHGDRIKEEKGKVLTPLLLATKEERLRWKPVEDMLAIGISTIRKEMTRYQTEQDKIAEEKKDKIAERVGTGKGKLKTDTAVKQMEEVDTPEQTVNTESGQVKFKTVKKFEVESILKLANWNKGEAILPNDIEIRIQMKAGVKLPGVRYYEEKVPINYR